MAQSSSGHDNASVSKEELEYLYASNVNVSNFVSVKLSGQSNYHIWKAQMLSLLDRLKIRDIVENRDAWLKSKSEDIAINYDIFLKGWILGSLDEELRRHFDYSDDGQSIWRTLENYHGHISASKEELEEYMKASKVNVSDFVSVKLSILSNDYYIWKAQMLSLIDKWMIRDIFESRGDWLKSKSYDIAKKYDILLKGWILGSLDEKLLRRHFDDSDDVQSIWWTLQIYHRDVSASKEELKEYMHASNVNVSNFVSVKLSGQSNYHIWKAQMLSLLDKLMIRDFVENTKNWMKAKSKDITKRYNILLKGWILGSLNEEVLRHFDYSANVQSIWWTLEDEYCFRGYPTDQFTK
ncbi:ankyrin repeat-containing domain, Gag-polypeptide of LTR copia-type [Artemisia annua]|uniref:Ankyrin repeat-containing domain, Gag-polypeptide of LTR copia-type n=1 Tax=Artemisia annua TaxID=35608 RepID=A0A2U1Q6H4_ARTAN|nr:ankyrin repeat-containing domain, Gag-polypeptide of LTR copia-type [Artemisia annua]